MAKLRTELEAKTKELQETQEELRALRTGSEVKETSGGASSQGGSSQGGGGGGAGPGGGDRTQELEARVKALSMQHAAFRDKVAARLEEKNRLIAQYEEQQAKRGGTKEGGGGGGGGGDVEEVKEKAVQLEAEVTSLRKTCATHSKERRAIQTIMEHKIKKLVDNISTATGSLPAGGGQGAGMEQRLAREVSALQRLVNAAVAALR